MNRNDIGDGVPQDAGEAAPQSRAAIMLKGLSPADWARFGVQEIAYLRPILVDGAAAVAIHAADGTPIGAAPSLELAAAAVMQHEMAPALVH